MRQIIDTFLSLASPATILGAVIFSDGGKKAIQPINVHSAMAVVTWVVELAALWFSYLMFANLHAKSQKKEDDDILNLNQWMYFIRAIFVSVVVVINLVAGISMGTSKAIQVALCGGAYHDEEAEQNLIKVECLNMFMQF